jgi:hypothetical protein
MSATVLTVDDLPHVNAFGDRLTGVFDLLKRLQDLNLDLSSLARLFTAIGEIQAATTTKGKVIASLVTLRMLAEITPTDTDDKIVAAVATLLSGKTLDLLCNLVDSWLGNQSLALAAVESEVTAAGINWSTFVELAKLVLALIRSRQGN